MVAGDRGAVPAAPRARAHRRRPGRPRGPRPRPARARRGRRRRRHARDEHARGDRLAPPPRRRRRAAGRRDRRDAPGVRAVGRRAAQRGERGPGRRRRRRRAASAPSSCSTTRSTAHATSTKTDTMRVSAFRDGAGGPLGWVDGDGRVVLNHRPVRGDALRGGFATSTSRPRASTSSSPTSARTARSSMRRWPWVRAGSSARGAARATRRRARSRRSSGPPGRACHRPGDPGRRRSGPAGRVLSARGWVAADDLPPWKARILLRLALADGSTDLAEIQPLFDAG